MLGMLGIIVQNNEIKNTTQILQVVKPGETYMVKFLNPPVFNRVCSTEEIMQWLLFATQAEADTWVKASSGPRPGEQAPGKPPVQGHTTGGAAKPNGSGSDQLDDEIEDEPDPIVPAKPVDHRRFKKPVKDLSPPVEVDPDKEDDNQ